MGDGLISNHDKRHVFRLAETRERNLVERNSESDELVRLQTPEEVR